jgi:hypothetical protein
MTEIMYVFNYCKENSCILIKTWQQACEDCPTALQPVIKVHSAIKVQLKSKHPESERLLKILVLISFYSTPDPLSVVSAVSANYYQVREYYLLLPIAYLTSRLLTDVK